MLWLADTKLNPGCGLALSVGSTWKGGRHAALESPLMTVATSHFWELQPRGLSFANTLLPLLRQRLSVQKLVIPGKEVAFCRCEQGYRKALHSFLKPGADLDWPGLW